MHFATATNFWFPPCQDLGAERSEWLLTGAGSKIANDRLEGAKQPLIKWLSSAVFRPVFVNAGGLSNAQVKLIARRSMNRICDGSELMQGEGVSTERRNNAERKVCNVRHYQLGKGAEPPLHPRPAKPD